jgi:hypothetical protein
MESDGSSPYTQEPATCPYSEPDQSSLRLPPPNLSKIHFNIILPSTLASHFFPIFVPLTTVIFRVFLYPLNIIPIR